MNILLPIETINREIDFKIVLGALLAGGNNKIYIGQHNFLMQLLPKLENGIYVGKNIFHKRSEIETGQIYKKLKNKGFHIVYIHEEGAVFKGDADYWKKTLHHQYNLDFFDKNDVICDWGDFQKEYDKSRSQNLRIKATGHPRFDLYKKTWRSYFQEEVEEIKKDYGDYVLINGNYGIYNHGVGLDYVLSDRMGYKPQNETERLERINYVKYIASQCFAMVHLTHQLSVEYPHINFIYRPHPSENQEFYETVFRGVKNIFVKHEGSVSAWILASKAIIHDGCTTAVEASLVDKPVINFKPIHDERSDIWLPNQLGTRCITFEDVKKVLDNISQYTFNLNELKSGDVVKSLIYNFENDSFSKFTSIIKDEITRYESLKTSNPSGFFIALQYYKMKTKKKLYQLKNSSTKNATQYHTRKFYGFDKKYVEKKFKTIEKMLDKKIEFKFHNPYLIEVI